MKLHLIYFSPGGSTKQSVINVAKGISDMEVFEYDMLRPKVRAKQYTFDKNDLVIIGMPTASKLFGLPKEILNAIKGNNTPFVGIVTCGNGYYGKGIITLKNAMESRGFNMIAGGGFVGQYSFDASIANDRPDIKDEAEQMAFGKKIQEKLVVRNDRKLHMNLKTDWPDEGAFSTVKLAIISVLPTVGAGLPKSLNEFNVKDNCIKCKKCVHHCPVEAIKLNETIEFDRSKCIGCQGCVNICPVSAIEQVNPTIIKMVDNVKQYRDKRKPLEMFI